jgi:hypothetical protein
MIWIGVAPNALLETIRPSVETVQSFLAETPERALAGAGR